MQVSTSKKRKNDIKELEPMLKYDKLFKVLKANGYTPWKVRESSIIGQATYWNLVNGRGHINWQTIDKVCRLCHCQPGDIMEYVEDETVK